MKTTDAVTKSEYQDGMVGYYYRIPKESVTGLGWANANHQILKALAVCIREMNNDWRLARKAYINLLKDGDVTVNVVCWITSELGVSTTKSKERNK